MAGDNIDESYDRLTPLLGALTRLGTAVGPVVAGGTAQLAAIQRHELRRVAALFALCFTAAIFACGAAARARHKEKE